MRPTPVSNSIDMGLSHYTEQNDISKWGVYSLPVTESRLAPMTWRLSGPLTSPVLLVLMLAEDAALETGVRCSVTRAMVGKRGPVKMCGDCLCHRGENPNPGTHQVVPEEKSLIFGSSTVDAVVTM